MHYYAAYIPEVNIKTNKIQKESILFFDDNGKMTLLFAISCLCHEMIHQYDAHYGIWLNIAQEDSKLGIDRSHDTPFFVKYAKLAAMEGLRVMTDSRNTPFDILNREAIQFSLQLQENEDEAFKRLVERLKAGEKIPNVCLTDRNTVAFFVT
jgi:hypothetical protein